MKIGIVQVNTVIGDFAGNTAKVAEAYAKCVEGGADLVVAPELGNVHVSELVPPVYGLQS